jgi:ABC-type Zn uptake system ZnuABC Zn-binding protein ZnuA
VRAVGGDEVEVSTLVGGAEDPHAVTPSPAIAASLQRARLLVVNGLGLEDRWLPVLLARGSSAALQPGGRGYLDASRVVRAMEVPENAAARAAAGNHPLGNPHYLLDPVNGLRVAAAIRDALEALRPGSRQALTERYEAFRAKLGAAMVGQRLASKYPVDKLADLYAAGKLEGFLEAQHERALLEGWFAARAEAVTTRVIADHDVWPYFGRRFHVSVQGSLEPRYGAPPTRRQAEELIAMMRRGTPDPVLSLPYFHSEETDLVAKDAGARVVPMAHQVGARPGTGDYVDLIDYDVRALAP